jgi:hypothetical protein
MITEGVSKKEDFFSLRKKLGMLSEAPVNEVLSLRRLAVGAAR